MATFYTGVDKSIYEGGDHYLPMEKFRLGPYNQKNLSYTGSTSQPQSYGIPNTNAFTYSGGDGGKELDLTYDPRAVAENKAASVNKPFQTYTSLSSNRGPEIVMENLQKFQDQNLIDKYREYNPGKYDKYSDREMFEIGLAGLDDPKYETNVIPGHPNIFEGNVKTLEDEDKESWYSSLFSRTPQVRGTLGTRLANAPRLPFPAAMASWSLSPFNEKSRNYNPRFEHQLNMLEMQGVPAGMIGIDPGTGHYVYGPDSVLAGKNVISLFGSNDYEEALDKQKSWFENRINQGKKISWDKYKELIEEEKKLEDVQKNLDGKDKSVAKTISPQHHGDVSGGGVRGKGGQGDYTTPSIRDISKEEHGGGTGITASSGMHGGKHFKYGGLARLL